jgi:hypothetical protein
MSMLSQITTGQSNSGIRVVLAGVEKMGKTTLACNSPGALLIPTEVGFGGVTAARVPLIERWDILVQTVQEITAYVNAGQFPYKSLVFDSGTAIERLIHDYVIFCDKASNQGQNKNVTMASAHGGFGKAYDMANSYYVQFLAMLDYLADKKGINIIMTAHVFSSEIVDPTVGQYNTWDLLLHSPKNNKTYGKREITTQWADVIGFLYEPLYLIEHEKSGTSRGISQNKGRMLAVSRTPSYVAGNRFDLTAEIAIPAPPENGWNSFADALYKAKGIDVYTR